MNGEKLDEPYLTQTTQPFDAARPSRRACSSSWATTAANSLDSRFGFGFVPIDKVIGKAFIKIWPPSRFGLLN